MRRGRVGAGVLGLLVACSGPDKAGPQDTAPSAYLSGTTFDLQFDGDPPRSVLLIVVDTLRRDHVSVYPDAVLPTTPWLASQADHVYRVDGYHHPAAWTAPNTGSLLSALEPLHHGLILGEEGVGAVDAPLLPETFQAAGYATAQLSANRWVGADTGMGAGFDWTWLEHDAAGTDLYAAALDWMDAQPVEQPLFLHLQPMEPHTAYNPPAAFRGIYEDAPDDFPMTWEEQQRLMDSYTSLSAEEQASTLATLTGLYAEEVLAMDDQIRVLVEALDARGRLDDTLLVLTNDHGEAFNDGQDGEFLHGQSLRPEVTSGPLVFYNPRLIPGETTALVSSLDLLPALAGALGLDVPGGLDGLILDATTSRDAAFAGRYGRSPTSGAPILQASVGLDGDIRVHRTCDGETVAYDMVADPHELSPLAVDEVSGGPALLDALVAWQEALLTEVGYPTDCDGAAPPP